MRRRIAPACDPALSARAGDALAYGGYITLILLAAVVAALLAHIGIDIAGDSLLPHDTYDDIAHHSRFAITVIASGIMLTALLRLICIALRDTDTRTALPLILRRIVPRSPWVFAASVACASVGTLMAMEFFDSVLAGSIETDPCDLIGGSFALGLGIAIPTALLIALSFWRVARWLVASSGVLVRAIHWLVSRRIRFAIATPALALRRASRPLRLRSLLATCAAKRGPPLLVR